MLNNMDSTLPGPLLVVEDDEIVRNRLGNILASLGYSADDFTFATTIAEARNLFKEQAFALAMIDLGLPDGNGADLIRWLHTEDPALPLLVISAWSNEEVILGALIAGATGYLLKERDDIEIAISIRSVLRGGAPIDPFVARRVLELFSEQRRSMPLPKTANDAPGAAARPALTRRETEILKHVGTGLSNTEIADTLGLSRLTVECHIKNTYKKLSVHSRTEALFEARLHGLLS